MILGTELPAFCVILISCERMFAVLTPTSYSHIFYGRFKFSLLMVVPLASMGASIVLLQISSADKLAYMT
uniref:7TM_GPCR_Srx domain-containing protein n=1 Tax=Heterorhabditis bacteriophora TaxID=37862 RepID=A0A1I7X5K5_HETBA